MTALLDIAAANLLSPYILFFALGVGAALLRSDLSIPEPVTKSIAIYLMLAIGFKGGADIAGRGVDAAMLYTFVAAVALSFFTPFLAFGMLRVLTGLPRADMAAIAAHYGSISIVTFVAATEALGILEIPYEAYMVAAVALMETPAIVSALWLARKNRMGAESARRPYMRGEVFREVALNGSVVTLLGAFLIGVTTGDRYSDELTPFLVDPFKGILCLFLLDMGLLVGRGYARRTERPTPVLIVFACIMPLLGAFLAAISASLIGLSLGGAALLITLAASASYIAVPAAMRLALPEARPSIYLTIVLGVTFPFNLTVGIPIYLSIAKLLSGAETG